MNASITKKLLLAATLGLTFSSCKKDDDNKGGGQPGGGTRYVVAATPIASTGVADYLLTSSKLTEGSISTIGNGTEQDGTYRYYVTHKNKFFSLLYGQGNPGAVTTYRLNEKGELSKNSDFQTETVHVFAPVKDDILLIRVPRSGTNESAQWFRVNADQEQIVANGQVNIVHLAGNGERAHFTWAKQVGDKVYAPYMSIKGAAPDVFGTAYPDSSWIAVFSYPSMQLEKVIRDNRTSSIGAYFTDGLAVTEGGDVYAFSPASATNNSTLASTKPSGFLRIKAGQSDFDQSYFFNVQQASGGHHIYRQDYIGNGKVLLQMYGQPNSIATDASVFTKFAIVDVINQTFSWVNGMPADVKMGSTSRNNLVADDHASIYVGTNSVADGAYVYTIDAATAKATRGLKVEGGAITSINKLTY